MSSKLVKIAEGEIFAIPLFVSDKSPITRFSKKDFLGENKRFAFARVVTDTDGSGLIIEVLDLIGSIKTSLVDIVGSVRLFRPIVVSSLAIYKKRWPRIGIHPGYDKERDSAFSTIELVLSPADSPVLWRGGRETPIALADAGKYEPWTIWGAHQVEKRILEELSIRSRSAVRGAFDKADP